MMPTNSPEYQQAIRNIKLPESDDHKIIYFLWLDDQVMELWSDYLILKSQAADYPPYDQKVEKQLQDKLALIDYFEMYLDALRLYIDYDQIDQWVIDNKYGKKIIFNRF
jgi:hypothetical protein